MKKLILLLFTVMPLIGICQTDSTQQKKDSLEAVEEDPTPALVETLPKYPGGNTEMAKFISKHLKYPRKARKEGIEGIVVVQFIVDREGNVTKPKVLRDIGYGCGEAALKVVKKMPKWKPATQRGKPVLVTMTLPVKFKLK